MEKEEVTNMSHTKSKLNVQGKVLINKGENIIFLNQKE